MATTNTPNRPNGILDLRTFVICAISFCVAALSATTAGFTAHTSQSAPMAITAAVASVAFVLMFLTVAKGLHAFIRTEE
ncbi:hypothetical protein IEQ44_07965 [Nocardioides sp. Y6]|uniref:Uncharacterized protein n=1 Tax=Nocardioides malaquae TaxID=2773426 RepID=A0ABR9RTY4_9ACTN|nr:hypothetical protein [Nocardioides malaquae]MBE7324585.1 hypothetical protein [Nocardioides malaquae]